MMLQTIERVRTIDIADLAAAQRRLGVVAGPAVIARASASAPPAPLHVVADAGTAAALQSVNAQIAEVGPLMCRFVRDVSLQGAGYLFHGDLLVTDGSHLSDVAAEWVERPMPDSPRARQPVRERVVEELAIVGIAPGHLIYGHWLVDFIPRFMLARAALGEEFAAARIVLPHDTPAWALAMLEAFTGTPRKRCIFYERGVERLALRRACVPAYVHHHYAFHPYADRVFAALGYQPSEPGPRRLCISRVAFEGATHGVQKLFHTREAFEAEAVRRGYEIVRPETMSIREQSALFAGASHVVGEYGSALHSAVFAAPGLRMGTIRCPNAIQLRIAALRRQPTVVVLPCDDRIAANGVNEYSLTPDEMSAFFDANEA